MDIGRFALAWLVLAAGLLPAVLPAQQSGSLAPGTRVRVRLPETWRQVVGPGPRALELRGTVVSATADTLVLAIPGTTNPLPVPRSAITGLAVSRGAPSRATSAVLNIPHGAALGAALGLAGRAGDERDFPWERVGRWAAVGASFGLVWGALWPAERWRGVPARVVPAAGPAPGGMALAASLAF